MAKKEEKMKIFVPAMALQHYDNKEEFTLERKIIAALQRYYMNDNFEDPLILEKGKPYVFVENFRFIYEKLGYDVEAKVCL